MNIDFFLERCDELWPGKALTLLQRSHYGGKLMQFEGQDLGKIFDYLTEHSKFFPKIADVFDAARQCGLLDRVKAHKPHEWHPTECRNCGGSGMLAVFFEWLFDSQKGEWIKQFRRVMQYQASNPTERTNDWTRYVFRCGCPAGEASTIEKGIPRWAEVRA